MRVKLSFLPLKRQNVFGHPSESQILCIELKCLPVHPRSFRNDSVTEVRTPDTRHASTKIPPLLENEWVEMGDPAPLRRRTHGGAGAALALVKPLPPKAVAGRRGKGRRC